MVEITKRTVEGQEVPSVALTNATARAGLDELLARHSKMGRCRILLAIESLVSMRCRFSSSSMGVPQQDHSTKLFRLGDDGAVEEIEVWSLFHPGLRDHELRKLLLHDPAAEERRVALGRNGLELTYPFRAGVGSDRLSWREIGPFVRADGPLGPVLTKQGLALAPAGTTLPALSEVPRTLGLWADAPGRLMALWTVLPEDLQKGVRIVNPGGRRASALIFPPGTPRERLEPLANSSLELRDAFYFEPMGQIAFARATDQLEISWAAVVKLSDETHVLGFFESKSRLKQAKPLKSLILGSSIRLFM